ncbi:hypothetical protein LCGC14_0266200 [marine sediment metagenome]|uniref:Uncharacterized protein n=1 Tax=marine sediment metagenome TaxID=412755 RepID=A0A0F9UH18_9ZZZZ
MKSPPLCIKACFFLLFILSALFARTQTVQELQYSISRPELTEKERINILYTLSRELTYVDNIKSLEYAEEALTLATDINDIDGIGLATKKWTIR